MVRFGVISLLVCGVAALMAAPSIVQWACTPAQLNSDTPLSTPPASATSARRLSGMTWLDESLQAGAAWRPRDAWPPPGSTLPATVDVVQWSPHPSWQASLFRRAYPALIKGSPAGVWPALHRWAWPTSARSRICGVVDTLTNVLGLGEEAVSPADTFFYLNPQGVSLRLTVGVTPVSFNTRVCAL